MKTWDIPSGCGWPLAYLKQAVSIGSTRTGFTEALRGSVCACPDGEVDHGNASIPIPIIRISRVETVTA